MTIANKDDILKSIQVFIDSKSEINAIKPSFTQKLDLYI